MMPQQETLQENKTAFRLGYRPALDGLRGICVLLVIASHMDLPILKGGFLGVDGFFVLSGFLITSLLWQEWHSTGAINLLHFYARRALRLLPALAVLLAVCTVYTSWFTAGALASTNWQGILSALSYSSNWTMMALPQHGFWSLGILAHTWSLAIEEQFYLIWPLILLFILRRRLAPRGLITAVVSLLIGSTVLRTILFASGATTIRLFGGTDTRADALLSGCLLALLLSLGKISPSNTLYRITGITTLVSIIALGYLCIDTSDTSPGLYYGGFTLVALGVATIILHLMTAPSGFLSRTLSSPALVKIGVISYGLYLWHYPVFQIMGTNGRGWADWQTQLSRLLVTFIITVISFRYLERPILRFKYRLAEQPIIPATCPVINLPGATSKNLSN